MSGNLHPISRQARAAGHPNLEANIKIQPNPNAERQHVVPDPTEGLQTNQGRLFQAQPPESSRGSSTEDPGNPAAGAAFRSGLSWVGEEGEYESTMKEEEATVCGMSAISDLIFFTVKFSLKLFLFIT